MRARRLTVPAFDLATSAGDVTVTCHGNFVPGWPGNREEPPEYPEFEFVKGAVDGGPEGSLEAWLRALPDAEEEALWAKIEEEAIAYAEAR